MKIIKVSLNTGRNPEEFRWAISRARDYLTTEYFCFFVDETKTSWSKHLACSQAYKTEEGAKEDMKEIRQRQKKSRNEIRQRQKKSREEAHKRNQELGNEV